MEAWVAREHCRQREVKIELRKVSSYCRGHHVLQTHGPEAPELELTSMPPH